MEDQNEEEVPTTVVAGYYRDKNKLPSILQANPDMADTLKTFVRTNLDGISGEKMFYSMHDRLLPTMIINGKFGATKYNAITVQEGDKFYEENNDGSTGDDVDDDVISASKKEFLQFYGLTEICIGTVY
mmetsp:Transcript_19528/g.21843  ORF Transcript_19528/g.21843 Transcript_19528/m.21843 type:complete len:129 (+) Transcript_19528:238-624(+)